MFALSVGELCLRFCETCWDRACTVGLPLSSVLGQTVFVACVSGGPPKSKSLANYSFHLRSVDTSWSLEAAEEPHPAQSVRDVLVLGIPYVTR
ncbi:uncharacterized protein BDW70DRAFT_65166 [Aspergillus foveolatus]|uniref:uncharacterized protein n=1 Tax=Aspergillus foveolatus TaxID=210207 RepID=UPI003CCCF4BC